MLTSRPGGSKEAGLWVRDQMYIHVGEEMVNRIDGSRTLYSADYREALLGLLGHRFR